MFSIQGFLTCQSKLLMKYKHLSQAERYQIYALMKAGHDQTQIAKLLDRHKSTISRELRRNTGSRGYRPKQACELSEERAQNSRNAPTIAPWIREEACTLLCLQWSPQQIASQLPISHEALYSMFMQTKRKAVLFGRTCAARSKRGNAMRVVGIVVDKSPTEGP